jgi:uncharacterized protein (DUF169 family)
MSARARFRFRKGGEAIFFPGRDASCQPGAMACGSEGDRMFAGAFCYDDPIPAEYEGALKS